MKKEFLIGLGLIVMGFLVLAYQGYRLAANTTVFRLAPVHETQEVQIRLPLTPLFGAVAMFAGVVLIVRDRDRVS